MPLVQVSPSCYAVLGIAFLPGWTVNAGLVVGKGKTLIIDTGPNRASALAIYGHAIGMDPQNTLVAVNSEEHLDHMGGNSTFKDTGIPIFGHYRITAAANGDNKVYSELDEFTSLGQERGEEKVKVFLARAGIAHPDQPIYFNMSLPLGALEAQIILTPGHTPTSVSVYITEEGVLFCGDCIVGSLFQNPPALHSEMCRQWLESIHKIEALGPEVVVPGHGAVLRGGEIREEIGRIKSALETAISKAPKPR